MSHGTLCSTDHSLGNVFYFTHFVCKKRKTNVVMSFIGNLQGTVSN
jgi:hypothetical protein